MTFYEFQIFSSIAIFIVRQLAIWFGPDHLVFFDIKFADLTLYFMHFGGSLLEETSNYFSEIPSLV